MRISTSMLNQSAANGIMQDEAALAQTQNQLSTGKSVNTPADNPVAMVQLLQLDNTNSQYQQYISNGQSANTNLTLEEQRLIENSLTELRFRFVQVSEHAAKTAAGDAGPAAAKAPEGAA